MKKRGNLLWQLPFLTILIIGTVLIIREQQTLPYQHHRGFIFGTEYSVTYQSDHDYQTEIEKVLHKVDQSLSPFNPHSIITKVNQNIDVRPNQMFMDVFRLARQISQDTDGAFDITVAPLVNAWGFGFKSGESPTPHSIDSLLQLIGYEKVSVGADGRIRKSDPRIMLDCSAIAKGYGSDMVAKLLRSKDVSNYMIEIGGEVVTHGVNEKRLPWRIGVTKPTDDSLQVNNELQTVLNVTDKAMATSGNYRNFYYKGGKKYAHTVDPKTGYPVQHSLLSATVLANSCAMADAYATAFMVMGMEKAREVIARHNDLMVYFIYSDPSGKNAVWYSPALASKIME